jgi:hypothetical protein
MVHRFEFQSALPASVVLDRIRADAEDWRESRLSAAARERSLYGFALKIRKRRFWLRVRGGSTNPFAPICQGEVADAHVGSRIVATFRPPRLTVIAGVLWIGAIVAGVIMAPWSPPVRSPLEGIAAALFAAVAATLTISLGYGIAHFYRREAQIWHDEIAALLRRASNGETHAAAPHN